MSAVSTEKKSLTSGEQSTTSPTQRKATTISKTTNSTPSTNINTDADDHIYALFQYLLTQSDKLQLQEYIHDELGRRFNILNGQNVLAFLSSLNYTSTAAKFASTHSFNQLSTFQSYDMQQFIDVINAMIARGYIKRVMPLTVHKKRFQTNSTIRCVFAEDAQQSYDVDGLYAILLQPENRTWLLIKALLIVGGIFAVCLYKIWPIILRIILWWVLLLFTCVLLGLIVMYYISSIMFTIVGKRGFSFMPNLFDEEISFFQTFTPLFGYGKEHQHRWALERELQLRARLKLMASSTQEKTNSKDFIKLQKMLEENNANLAKLTNSTPNSTTSTTDALTTDDYLLPEENIFLTWKAGLIGFLSLFIIGGVIAFQMGLFSPENVPDFVVNNAEMRTYFPSLSAPTRDDLDDIANDYENIRQTVINDEESDLI